MLSRVRSGGPSHCARSRMAPAPSALSSKNGFVWQERLCGARIQPDWARYAPRDANGEWRMARTYGASCEWRMASGEKRIANCEWRIANSEWRMAVTCIANGEWRIANGEWRLAGTCVGGFSTPPAWCGPGSEVPDAGTLQPAATARFRARPRPVELRRN